MESFWERDKNSYKQFNSITNNMETSVCIIGGGLSGLSTGYYLSKKMNIVILEKDNICSHTSGKNTGKITSQHGLFYNYLMQSQGKEYARKYLDANEDAIRNIEEIIKREKIECDFSKQSNYVFTTKETLIQQLKDEEKSVNKISKTIAKYKNKIDLEINAKGALEFINQAQFNPFKYGHGLADSIINSNGKIFENSQVTDIKKENGKYAVYANKCKVVADYIVIATRYPIIKIPGYYFLKMYQSTSYAIVVDTKTEMFDGMYISLEVPTISFRKIKDGNKELLLAVGYDYKTGTDNIKNGYSRLEALVRKMYPNSEILYKWSAEDCITLDKIPYIGMYSNIMPNVYILTGFNKWGITSSNIGANIIANRILENKNEIKYEDIFDSRRLDVIKNRKEFSEMIKEANKSIILSKFKIPKQSIEDIKIGEGKIVKIDSKKVGVYKSSDGNIYAIKPVCTHLGCELHFNNVDKIWECPCHGSKFSYEGKIIESPANKKIDKNILKNDKNINL